MLKHYTALSKYTGFSEITGFVYKLYCRVRHSDKKKVSPIETTLWRSFHNVRPSKINIL